MELSSRALSSDGPSPTAPCSGGAGRPHRSPLDGGSARPSDGATGGARYPLPPLASRAPCRKRKTDRKRSCRSSEYPTRFVWPRSSGVPWGRSKPGSRRDDPPGTTVAGTRRLPVTAGYDPKRPLRYPPTADVGRVITEGEHVAQPRRRQRMRTSTPPVDLTSIYHVIARSERYADGLRSDRTGGCRTRAVSRVGDASPETHRATRLY